MTVAYSATRGARLGIGLALSMLLAACSHHRESPAANYAKPAGEQNYESAIESYRAQYESDPNDLSALLGLSRSLRYSGQGVTALQTLERARAKFATSPDYYTELGKAHLVSGNASEARRALTESVDRGSADWKAYSALGVANDLQQNYSDARAAYDHALVMCPDSAPILNNKSLSLAADGDLDTALRLMKQAYRVQPRSQRIAKNLAALQTLQVECGSCSRERLKDLVRSIFPTDWKTSGDGPMCDPNHLMAADIVKSITEHDYVDLHVNFNFDSAELLPAAKEALDELGRALTSDPLAKDGFRLEGHTDAVGTDAYNMDLSMRRANAVKAYLVGSLGIEISRLTAKGFGESRLLDPKNPTSGVNRRVRIVRTTEPDSGAPGPVSSR